MANYLHGVETVDVLKGALPVRVVKSSVIGLVGIAPNGPKNTPVLVLSEQDHAQFGDQLPGFTIPQALAAIASQGAGTVVVVNVWDEASHATAVNNEVLQIANGKAKTAFAPVGATALVLKSNDGNTTYVAGTDYKIDVYGNIQVLSTEIANGDQPKATYKKLNASAVTASVIIGSVDGTTNARTGMKCFDLVYPTWGFKPRKMIAPGYSVLNAVKAEMISLANKYRGHAYIDAPEGITPSVAISGRGGSGAAVNFQTSDKRAMLFYPMVKAYEAASDSNVNRFYSAYFAGMRAATMDNEGPHVSSSNKEIKGIVGVERTITASIDDPNTEANALNEVGITTVFNAFGSGIRSWGNRSAAWPTSTAPSNFECVQDVADILRESVDQAMLQFIDRPINSPIIDAIIGTVQNFLNTIKGRGWIVDGKISYDPAKNPSTEIALGHLTFDLEFMPPTPMERVTFNHFININLLKAL